MGPVLKHHEVYSSMITRLKDITRYFLLTIFIYGATGCAREVLDPAQLRADETALIKTTVTDPARAARFLDLLLQRDRLIEKSSGLSQQYRQDLKTLNANYDASREEIVRIIGIYNRERVQNQLRFIELLADMKAATTAAEWKVIAEFQLGNFNHRQLVYGRATGAI